MNENLNLSSNYITCTLIGRLGNQMFQIANAYAQSLRHNRQLVLPYAETSTSDYYDTVHRKLDFIIPKAPDATPAVHTINSTYHYTEYKPHDTLPTVFRGYFESEKFFKDHSENVKQLFGPTQEFIEEATRTYPQLVNGTNAVINVRRGDFLTFPTRHPVVTAGYLQKAYQMLPKVDTIFVVSDDIPWCRENIKFPNTVFVEYEPYKALWFLSLCQNFVVSNSTFTWWGAYLSKNPNKTVIAPGVWFGPDILREYDPKDVYCEGWKICPAVYDPTGFILPG